MHIKGEAEVLKQFDVTIEKKRVSVAGCQCVSGTLKKNGMYHLIRNKDVIYTGKLKKKMFV